MRNGLMKQGRGLAALVLLSVAMGTLSVPAEAKKKDKPTSFGMNDAFRQAAEQARQSLASGNLDGATAQVNALQPTSPLESYIAASLKMEIASRRNDPQAERKALTAMIESKGMPASVAPRVHFLAGYYSYYLADFDDAIAQTTYARSLGYTGVDSSLLLADATIKDGKRKEGLVFAEEAMQQMRAAGKPIPASWFDRAAATSYQVGAWPDVAKWYQQKLELYPNPTNWRTALANYLAAPGMDAQVQLDLYRLQAATGAMASERDYQTYAALADANGYQAEAKAIIEAGRTDGALTTKDTATATLMKTATAKAAKSIAALPAQAKKAAAASDGKAAMAVGDSYFSLGQYSQAVTQYKLALSKGGADAGRINTRLGVALARSGDLAGGKAALAQVNDSWSNVARFWTVWVDQQKAANPTAAATPGAAPSAG